jgi:hypothetical protein
VTLAGTGSGAGADIRVTGTFSGKIVLLSDGLGQHGHSRVGDWLRAREATGKLRGVAVRIRLDFGGTPLEVTASIGPLRSADSPADSAGVTDAATGTRVDCPQLIGYIVARVDDVAAEAAAILRDLDERSRRHGADPARSRSALIAVARLWLSVGSAVKACDELLDGAQRHGLDRQLSYRTDDPGLRALVDLLKARMASGGHRERADRLAVLMPERP